MPVRIAIVGHGRVGSVFARRFARAGADVMGFVGRDEARAQAAAAALGVGGALDVSALDRAHCVVFAVGDAQLEDAIEGAARVGGRRCSLWLHTSGSQGLDVFAPAAALGVRTGSLHPLAPFAASLDEAEIAGAPAVCQGAPRSRSLLERLCRMLELVPVFCDEHDRAVYHAACALAANGAAALYSLSQDLLERAGGMASEDSSRIVAALMGAAVTGARRHGASVSLSGPVRRGDAATVSAHVARLSAAAPDALPAYRALMAQAAAMAQREGLASEQVQAVLQSLAGDGASWRS